MKNIRFLENNGKQIGRYRLRTYEADQSIPAAERMRRIYNGETKLKKISPWIKNLIVSSEGYGLNIICRHLSGDDSIPLEISEMQIGSNSTAATSADTGLHTAVVTGISRASQTITGSQVSLSFFASDLELPNGTYRELGIFCGNEGSRRLFARSVISPEYTKSSAEDTTIEYIIEFTAI